MKPKNIDELRQWDWKHPTRTDQKDFRVIKEGRWILYEDIKQLAIDRCKELKDKKCTLFVALKRASCEIEKREIDIMLSEYEGRQKELMRMFNLKEKDLI